MPEREKPGPQPETGPLQKSGITKPANCDQPNAQSRLCRADTVGVQLRRRRQASYRREPLADGHRDPCQPWRPERLSDKQLEAAVFAAEHLLAVDLPTLFDLDTLPQLVTGTWRSNSPNSGG